MSYAQLNQDTSVITFYNKKVNGYFIDVGANDGINLSNTYLLERDYNWHGICIEPNMEIYSKLIKNRTAICSNKAVYSTSNEVIEFNEPNDSLFGGITQHIDYHFKTLNNSKKTYVNTITLTDLLDENKSPNFIDYMSLDTEGSELEILKGIDFDKYTFGYINLEHNYQEPRRTLMRELLLKKGYIYLGENDWDDDYMHGSLITGTYYYLSDYSKPITVDIDDQHNIFVKSSYWDNAKGTFDGKSLELRWHNELGTGKLYHNFIEYNKSIWRKKL